jgi:hypothetical protein
MVMMRVSFELRGETPCLFHGDDVVASDELSEWRKAPENKNFSKPGDDRSPAWTWITYLYHDQTHVTVPSDNVMVALRKAGAQIILKGNKTFKEMSQSGISIPLEFCEFLAGGKRLEWSKFAALVGNNSFKDHLEFAKKQGVIIDTRRAKNPGGKSKHIRCRMRVGDWQVRGELEVTAPEITMDVLTTMFDLAGRGGILDWRPSGPTPGPWGMFKAKLTRED